MTAIPYLDEVWNPVTGCAGIGCKIKEHCWAAAMVKRFPAIHGIRMGVGGSRHKS